MPIIVRFKCLLMSVTMLTSLFQNTSGFKVQARIFGQTNFAKRSNMFSQQPRYFGKNSRQHPTQKSSTVSTQPSSQISRDSRDSRTLLSASFSSSSWEGPMQTFVEETLTNTFDPEYLEVINESHGQLSDESHFKVIVVSSKFEGKQLVQRHRMVNEALQVKQQNGESEKGTTAISSAVLPFHSLTITAKTPDQWNSNNSVPTSPKCAGGGLQ